MADPWAAINKYSIAEDDPYSGVPPAMRGNVKQMVEGRAPVPAGAAMRNPHLMEMMRHANTVDYGFDASKWSARKTYRDGLAKTAPASPGGQRNAVNTMAGHLAEVADQIAALKNWDMGVTPLTRGVNAVRGMTTEQAAKINALNNDLAKFGAEETKYYAGAPGTGHERQFSSEIFSPNKSPQELAAALESAHRLFRGKADIMERQKNEILDKHGADISILSPESEDAFKRIMGHVEKLRGGVPTEAAGAPGAQAAPPVPDAKQAPDGKWYVPDPNRAGKYLMVQ